MPFRLVEIQQRPHLPVKPRIYMRQPLGQILVNSGFAYAEFFGGGADGRAVLDNVHGQIAGPFLQAVSHSHHSPARHRAARSLGNVYVWEDDVYEIIRIILL